MNLHRTYLFAPGNHPRKVAKVFGAGADAVVLDLEDAVAAAEKEATRTVVVEALQRAAPLPRLRAGERARYRLLLRRSSRPSLRRAWTASCCPRSRHPSQLETVDWLLGQLERERGLEQGAIDLLPIIETGQGVAAVQAIAGAETRVRRLSFGAGDYTRDMGMVWTGAEAELAHARASIVLASRVGGLEAPIDTVFIDLADAENLERSAETALSFGFQGKLCIHPEAGGAGEPRVHAERRRRGTGREARRPPSRRRRQSGSASIQVDGYFIDYPIYEKAERVLRIAEAIRQRDAQAAG